MYQPGINYLGGFTDDLTSIISAGAQAYRTITAPAIAPFSLPPYQGPGIDPRTGTYVPPPTYFPQQTQSNYTVPLVIGGGLLLLLLAGRRR